MGCKAARVRELLVFFAPELCGKCVCGTLRASFVLGSVCLLQVICRDMLASLG